MQWRRRGFLPGVRRRNVEASEPSFSSLSLFPFSFASPCFLLLLSFLPPNNVDTSVLNNVDTSVLSPCYLSFCLPCLFPRSSCSSRSTCPTLPLPIPLISLLVLSTRTLRARRSSFLSLSLLHRVTMLYCFPLDHLRLVLLAFFSVCFLPLARPPAFLDRSLLRYDTTRSCF